MILKSRLIVMAFQFSDRGELYGDIYLKGNKRYIVQGADKRCSLREQIISHALNL